MSLTFPTQEELWGKRQIVIETKAKNHRKLETRQVIVALGILLLTFGVFGWQWQAFSQRNQITVDEGQTSDPSEDIPPPNTHWHEAPKQVRLAVADCIRGQLNAFQSDQYEAGLQYHTHTVRQRIPSIQHYEQLIKTRYPSLAHHKRATFRFVNTDKSRHFANAGLTIVGADGAVIDAVYQLVWQDKQWLISGIAKRPPQSHSKPSQSRQKPHRIKSFSP